MSELELAGPLACLAKQGCISADDVRRLRMHIFKDGLVSRDEAEQLFALHAENPEQCQEWEAFFIEAIVGHVVHQERPAGYISEDAASWLIRAVSRGAVVGSAIEMELVVAGLEQAKASPVKLSAFALD